MRGDDPGLLLYYAAAIEVSPACAGMIPTSRASRLVILREPRMRGDDPLWMRTRSKALQ